MAMRYPMMAVVIVTLMGALETVPWGVNDELAARTSTEVESARPDTQRASVARVAEDDPELLPVTASGQVWLLRSGS